MLLEQTGPIRAYKLVDADYRNPLDKPDRLTYVLGQRIEAADADRDPNNARARGINVCTLDWAMRLWEAGFRILVVEFMAADIACIPTDNDGKFRLHGCTPVAEKDLVELGLVQLAPAARETHHAGKQSV